MSETPILPKWITDKLCDELYECGFDILVERVDEIPTMHIYKFFSGCTNPKDASNLHIKTKVNFINDNE